MLKLLCVVITGILTAAPLAAQETVTIYDAPSSVTERSAQAEKEPGVERLTPSVQMIYAALQTMHSAARKRLALALPADMLRGVWRHQLTLEARLSRQLTQSQREALLLAIGWLSVDRACPDAETARCEGSEKADRDLIVGKIESAFGRTREYAWFARIGGPGVEPPTPDTHAVLQYLRKRAEKEPPRWALPACECSTDSVWCWETPTSPENDCTSAIRCSRTSGCGTLWSYDCTGMCDLLGELQ